MKKFWSTLGQLTFWLSWPALWFYLHGSQRTRVLVVYEGKLLVTKQWLSDGRWSLPGGGRHRNEASLAGARRELREETGIAVEEAGLNIVSTELFSSHGLSFTYDLFLLKLNEKPMINRQAIEISEIRWADPSELSLQNSGSDVMVALQHWPR